MCTLDQKKVKYPQLNMTISLRNRIIMAQTRIAVATTVKFHARIMVFPIMKLLKFSRKAMF